MQPRVPTTPYPGIRSLRPAPYAPRPLSTAKQWEIWFVAIYNIGMVVVFLIALMELAQWVISGNATSHVDDLIRDWDAYKLHLLMEEQQLEATAYARDEEEKEREDQVSESHQLVLNTSYSQS